MLAAVAVALGAQAASVVSTGTTNTFTVGCVNCGAFHYGKGKATPEAFAAAVEAQARFSASAAGRRTGTVASEAVGDVRVTYRQGSASDGYAVRGDTVSPEAAAILTRAGLLTRWV